MNVELPVSISQALGPLLSAVQAARFAELRAIGDYVDVAIPGCERATYRVLGHAPDAPLPAEAFHLKIVRCGPTGAAAAKRGLLRVP